MFSYSDSLSLLRKGPAGRHRRTAPARPATSIPARRSWKTSAPTTKRSAICRTSVCYAVKANSSLGILALLAQAGSGFDIVSGGELYRVLKAGGDPAKSCFPAWGRRPDEIEFALEQRHPQLQLRVRAGTGAHRRAGRAARREGRFALRVNPDVDADTHPYISTGLREHKFGIDIHEAEAVYERARALHEPRRRTA